jgi:hypothetical protein
MPGAPILILMRGGFHFILMISPYFKPELYEFIYKTCPHNFALSESVKILDFVIGFMRRNSFFYFDELHMTITLKPSVSNEHNKMLEHVCGENKKN